MNGNSHSYTRIDKFLTTGVGLTVDVTPSLVRHFAIEVLGTGAVPTSWTVILEGSLDNIQFTTLMTHTNLSPGNGQILFSGAVLYPCLYFRAHCSALVLGSATNIVVTILGNG